MAAIPVKQAGPGERRAQGIDRHVGARMRERRIMLGLTQGEMAKLIGVTEQQAHKYEKAINRIAAGRLYAIAHALDVDVSYFFEDMDSDRDFEPTPQQREFLNLARDFISLPSNEKVAFCNLVRALASGEDLTESGSAPPVTRARLF